MFFCEQIDYLSLSDFDMDNIPSKSILALNLDIKIIEVSCKTGVLINGLPGLGRKWNLFRSDN